MYFTLRLAIAFLAGESLLIAVNYYMMYVGIVKWVQPITWFNAHITWRGSVSSILFDTISRQPALPRGTTRALHVNVTISRLIFVCMIVNQAFVWTLRRCHKAWQHSLGGYCAGHVVVEKRRVSMIHHRPPPRSLIMAPWIWIAPQPGLPYPPEDPLPKLHCLQ